MLTMLNANTAQRLAGAKKEEMKRPVRGEAALVGGAALLGSAVFLATG